MFDKSKLDEFIKWSSKKKLIVIYWPTASWKTSLSVDIAKSLDTEIISADSRQIFKYMDIWTAKITKDEMQGVKHYMIDIIEPNESYSVWEYKQVANNILDDIWSRWKIPIICGWTWLYIDSLIYDFSIPKVEADEKLRNELEQEAKEFWNEFVYEKLMKLDPDYAKTLHPNNLRYVIRAIEVKMLSGIAKTDFIKDKVLKYDTFFVTPYDEDRETLYSRIDKRVEIMIDNWLIDEVKKLQSMWYKESDFGMKTIWYKEIISYLNWEMLLEEAIALIQKNSRNYAKRQLTWFRKYDNDKW